MRFAGLAGVLALVAGMAGANPVERTVMPKPRPVLAAVVVEAARDLSLPLPRPRPERAVVRAVVTVATSSFAGALSLPRPLPRPKGLAEQAFAGLAAPKLDRTAPQVAVLKGVRPKPRPRNLDTSGEAEVVQAAFRAPQSKAPVQSKKGSVCGDSSIRGKVLAPITSKVKGCGIEEPVQVTEVAGVKLSQAATIDCVTAKAMAAWIGDGLQPAFKGRVVKVDIAGHYVCRTRNHKKGAKVSEHGRGRALDIAGVMLEDGTHYTIARDYRKVKAFKAAHKAACGIFGTTLGPGSDGYHEDHLHFDTARYRSGAYCR